MNEITALAETYNKPEGVLTEIYCQLIKKSKENVLRYMEQNLKAGHKINIDLFNNKIALNE